jgi:hypothetical protein
MSRVVVLFFCSIANIGMNDEPAECRPRGFIHLHCKDYTFSIPFTVSMIDSMLDISIGSINFVSLFASLFSSSI